MDAQLRADEAGADAETTRFLRERATHLEDALADLSHELRTSLNTILGVSRLMLERPVAPDQREDLRLVVRAAEALLMTAESILRPFGQAMGTHPVADAKIALGLVLEDLARGFGSEAAAKNLLLRVEHDGELPVVSAGDAARLRQVLSNLMANAIKFTERGQVLVSLRAMKAEGRAACEMVVADTGMGIEPSRQQAIFRRFTQASPEIARRFGGTGLGLAICREIVERTNGRIWVNSVPGRGSRFHVVFPLEEAAIEATPLSPVRSTQAARVLLVDDDPVSRRVCGALLERMGLEVVSAADGSTALAAWAEGALALVLLDIEMPGMDGLETARRMRASQRQTGRAGAPIVALSGHASRSHRARCRAAGIDEVLSKPIDVAALAGLVTRRMGQTAMLDTSALHAQLAGDHAVVEGVLAAFAQRLPDRIARLRAAADGRDWPTLGQLAHELAGCCAQLCAQRAAKAAGYLGRTIAASAGLSGSRGSVLSAGQIGVDRTIDRAARALELELRRLQVSLANRSLTAEAREGLAS